MNKEMKKEVTGLATNRRTQAKKAETREVKNEGVTHTLHWLVPLVGVFFLLYIGVSLFTDRTGLVGAYFADRLRYLFGSTALVPLLAFFYICINLLLVRKFPWRTGRVIGAFLLNAIISMAVALSFRLLKQDISLESVFRQAGGWFGSALIQMITPILGSIGTVLVLMLLMLIALCLLTSRPPIFFIKWIAERSRLMWCGVVKQWRLNRERRKESAMKEQTVSETKLAENSVSEEVLGGRNSSVIDTKTREKPLTAIRIAADQAALNKEFQIPQSETSSKPPMLEAVTTLDNEQASIHHLLPDDEVTYMGNQQIPMISEELPLNQIGSLQSITDTPFIQMEDGFHTNGLDLTSEVEPMETVLPREKHKTYLKPPLDILIAGKAMEADRKAELDLRTQQLEQTLEVFGVKAKVVHVSYGPTITRYELQLAPGIRVNKVANLSDDIALSLAATGVRIEAPIPGKPAIGIEVPNQEISIVTIRDVLSSPEFVSADKGVTVALGKDIAGRTMIADLSKMPHLLIAGATGSGKSVCMNCMITSLLYRFSPEQIKLIMIDPKVVEMVTYNGVPHLLAPVVTDPKKAAGVLKSVTREMDRRYELFATFSVKNIGQFNEKVLKDENREPLPYWVVFIDELADLMIVARDEVEESIIRIAQLARAAGIHLVIGTQRPSADIITGSIKANIPSRIAFAVSSGTDSRIILDMNGAEKLLGRGDMLFQPMGIPKPMRIQGAYISETEVEAVVSHVKMQGVPIFNDEILSPEEIDNETEDTGDMDDLFMQAARIVIESGQGSVSFLQRRLKVGHSRAGRIMDQLEEAGIVGPAQGSKPREVLLSKEQLENKFGD